MEALPLIAASAVLIAVLIQSADCNSTVGVSGLLQGLGCLCSLHAPVQGIAMGNDDQLLRTGSRMPALTSQVR